MPKEEYSLTEFTKEVDRIEKMLKVKFKSPEKVRGTIELAKMADDGTLVFPYDSSGVVKVHPYNVQRATNAPATNAAATVGVTTGEIWKILTIVAQWKLSAAVADRDASIYIESVPLIAGIAAALKVYQSVTLPRLTASQQGAIAIGEAGFIGHNDNGTVTFVEEPALPIYLNGDSSIYTGLANKDTDDRQAVEVFYQRVA